LLFTITGKHVSLTEDVRKYAEEKTSKLPRYYDSINQIEVIIDDAPNANVALEIIARAEHRKVFIVKQIGGDVYQCIDSAVHKLEGQLRKKKEKERDNKRSRGAEQL
jgi:putative sigma-54 modulation protein